MSHLPNTTTTPPGGWRYEVPETKWQSGSFSNWPQLKEVLRAHYTAAGYDFPNDIFDKVEAQICENNPEYCDESIVGRVFSTLRSIGHTFNAAYSCMMTLMANRAGGSERPTQDLANSRASTCAECPENGEIESCNHCNIASINRLVERIVKSAKTTSDGQLKFCKVCHCNLRAKVWTKHEAIWNHMSDKRKAALPKTCWVITEAREDERPL